MFLKRTITFWNKDNKSYAHLKKESSHKIGYIETLRIHKRQVRRKINMGYGFKIVVEGDYACFTRPELKVERVSYDVPSPGALEGMLKSYYWKPAIR